MNCGIQHALVIVAAIALPALVHASDPEMIAKRAAFFSLFAPQRSAEGFRSMDTAYPYHVIERGGSVAELPRAPRKLDVTYTFADKQRTLDDLLTRSRTQGFLVIKDGKIVDERYSANVRSGYGNDSCHDTASGDHSPR